MKTKLKGGNLAIKLHSFKQKIQVQAKSMRAKGQTKGKHRKDDSNRRISWNYSLAIRNLSRVSSKLKIE